ncbi:kinase-like domain-containing protein [Mycena floridula]|nr:kinase-like domain-containing protein [Mycena floridula]
MYFFREIKIWRSITPHVNVSPLIGYVYSADALELGLVSPLADTDLRRWAEAHQHFRDESTDRLRYALICDAAAGLIHLHNQVPPVIHGDLHARNVLISVAGQAMITDFGISKFGEAESTFSVESPDRPVLREAWLAPELIRNPRASRTMKSDLFALARTVLELFTARDPFHDQAPQNLTLHILQHGIPSRPDLISDEVWMLLQRCWAIDPRDRGTVNSFRADLSVHI